MHVTNIMECSNICVQAGAPGVTGQPAGGCISRSQAGAGRPGPGSVLVLSVALSSTQRISRYELCLYVKIILKTFLIRSNTAGSPTVTQRALLRRSVSFSRNLSHECVYQINTTIIHLKLYILCAHQEVDGSYRQAPLLAVSSQQPEFTGHHPIIV